MGGWAAKSAVRAGCSVAEQRLGRAEQEKEAGEERAAVGGVGWGLRSAVTAGRAGYCRAMPKAVPGFSDFLALALSSAVAATGAFSCGGVEDQAHRHEWKGHRSRPRRQGTVRKRPCREANGAPSGSRRLRFPCTGQSPCSLTMDSLPPGWLAAAALKCSSLSALMARVSSCASWCACFNTARLGGLMSAPAAAGRR